MIFIWLLLFTVVMVLCDRLIHSLLHLVHAVLCLMVHHVIFVVACILGISTVPNAVVAIRPVLHYIIIITIDVIIFFICPHWPSICAICYQNAWVYIHSAHFISSFVRLEWLWYLLSIGKKL